MRSKSTAAMRRPGSLSVHNVARGAAFVSLVLAVLASGQASAQGSGRLLGTGGAASIEATAGGGLSPWAVLAGYGAFEQAGCAGAISAVRTDDYALDVLGVACSWSNRIELSLGRQELDLEGLRPVLGLPADQMLRQHYVGLKLRVGGDIVYGRWGQWSVGLQYKQNEDGALVRAAGARRTADVDVYVSAGKLFLHNPFGRMLYLNGTLRATRANQTGLLGFGGDRDDVHSLNLELAAALFARRDLAFGIEYRQKPDNLSFAAEDDWYDVFCAWFPSKHVSVVAAWTELGSIGTLDDQRGPYLSVAGSF